MALKPLLKSKVDELFARWLSDPETQLNLKENLRQLCQGESITLQHLTSPKSSSKQSPRLRPSSPPYSPNSTKLPNPRSPRRALSNKNKANNGSPRMIRSTDVHTQCTSRSGASSTFLALLPPVHIFRWYLHIPVSAEPDSGFDGVKSHKLIPMPIVVLETF
uniref:Uncharacterized protein n=1 Tax=Magallana gigas TaxID=29159 RepID=A0A8W8IXM4_MAGGI